LPEKNDNGGFTRRCFLKTVSLGALSTPAALGALRGVLGAEGGKSRIVAVKGPGVMTGRKPDADKVRRMLEKGICEFTGKDDPSKAWREFVSPDDVVGIKINPIGGRALSTKRELVDAIVQGLKSAGLGDDRIVIWDRFEDHLKRVGYDVNVSGPGVKCCATEGEQGIGFDEDVFYESEEDSAADRDEPGTKSYLSKILTQKITALINVPVMKDHNSAGITLCLKNIAFGSVNNTRRFHKPPHYCDPMIADVCAMPVVQKKLRLNIVDALEACFDRGPTGMNRGTKWNQETIYFGTDLVALDAMAHDIIEKKRRERRLRPIRDRARHTETAAKKGLGTDDLSAVTIDTISVQ